MTALDTPTARRFARELIDAAVVGDSPEVILLQLDLTDAQQLVDVVQALVHHARALVRVVADATDITTAAVIDYMAAADWADEDKP